MGYIWNTQKCGGHRLGVPFSLIFKKKNSQKPFNQIFRIELLGIFFEPRCYEKILHWNNLEDRKLTGGCCCLSFTYYFLSQLKLDLSESQITPGFCYKFLFSDIIIYFW